MLYEAIGKVEEVGNIQTFSSGFTKRDVIVNITESGQKYPNIVKFTAVKDNCAMMDGLTKGVEVKIRFALEGRPWDGPKGRQYFVDLRVIRIEEVGAIGKEKSVPSPAVPEDGDINGIDDSTEMPF